MIFVTIGTQEPFDRLVRAIDEIASELEEDIIVQAPLKDYQPLNFKTFKFMDPGVFESNFKKADLIVSHAGMGTILLALELGKTKIPEMNIKWQRIKFFKVIIMSMLLKTKMSFKEF